MNASIKISRRAFAGGLALLGLARGAARAQGFAGLGESAEGFAAVVPGKTFAFPADHGPHPEFRIEWGYVTANLRDASGGAYGAQWTLVGQAGVETTPFHAWIDAWDMRGLDGMRDAMLAPLELKASGADFSYALRLDADRP